MIQRSIRLIDRGFYGKDESVLSPSLQEVSGQTILIRIKPIDQSSSFKTHKRLKHLVHSVIKNKDVTFQVQMSIRCPSYKYSECKVNPVKMFKYDIARN